jgi:glycosyltransferase involved in cell wall biosynthesis
MSVSQVLHITRRFNEEKWGGIETVVWNLVDRLVDQGIESSILTTAMFAEPGFESLGGVAVQRFEYSFPFWGLSQADKEQMALKGGSPLCLDMLKYLTEQQSCSVIHTHVLHRMGGVARTAAKKLGIPYVVTLHGGCLTMTEGEAERLQRPFRKKIEWGKIYGLWLGSRKVLEDAAAIICVGEDEWIRMREIYPKKEVILQPNGVDVKRFEKKGKNTFKADLGMSDEQTLILCISRLDPQKNQILLIEAFAEYVQSKKGAKLCLMGSISNELYYEKIKKCIRDLGLLENVVIINDCSFADEKLTQAYQAADVFVLPSVHEPFGIVILEAWASGTPVIASALGGIMGFTESEKNVLHFEKGNRDQLVACMKRLENEILRNDLISEGSKAVQKYDWSIIAQEHRDLYDRVAK